MSGHKGGVSKPVRRNSSALQGRWPNGAEGFPAHATIPHGAQDGCYARRMAHKRVVTTPAPSVPGLIYNKVSSPPHVRIRENPHFFEKKVAVKFAGKQEMAYLCTRNRENNRLREEKRDH